MAITGTDRRKIQETEKKSGNSPRPKGGKGANATGAPNERSKAHRQEDATETFAQ